MSRGTGRCRRKGGGRAAGIALLVLLMIGTLPGKAMAGSGSITGPLLISAAVTGAVAVVLLIGIMAGGSEEKGDFLAARAMPAARADATGGGRLRLACAYGTNGGLALLCW